MKNTSLRSLIIVYSWHHNNTEKVARAMGEALDAGIACPRDIDPMEIPNYDLVGFGAGIDSGRHYEPLLKIAGELSPVKGQKAFIFSTSAITGEKKRESDHSALRNILIAKGYEIVDEFHCRGFNTNSFLKLFGGMNRGRPNGEDLEEARAFAQRLV